MLFRSNTPSPSAGSPSGPQTNFPTGSGPSGNNTLSPTVGTSTPRPSSLEPRETPNPTSAPSQNPTQGNGGGGDLEPIDVQINMRINVCCEMDPDLNNIYLDLDDLQYSKIDGVEKIELENFDIINHQLFEKGTNNPYPAGSTLQLNFKIGRAHV